MNGKLTFDPSMHLMTFVGQVVTDGPVEVLIIPNGFVRERTPFKSSAQAYKETRDDIAETLGFRDLSELKQALDDYQSGRG